jgi:hypothetical protein
MTPDEHTGTNPEVWCPLIPMSKLAGFSQYLIELERVNERYDDWRASMRAKKIVGVHIGVLLDRIRILMMGIGIACASNRTLADSIQSIITDCLRKSTREIVDKVKAGKPQSVIETMDSFFSTLRFTRDIYPEEEITKAYHRSGGSPDEETAKQEITIALDLSATVVKAVYLRMLSPDPWQYTSDL